MTKNKTKIPLWQPSQQAVNSSNMTAYTRSIAKLTGHDFKSYIDLHQWSVENIEQFWESIWDQSEIIHSAGYNSVLSNREMPGAKWFEGARLNFAENLLKYRDDQLAIIHWREKAEPTRLTYRQLYDKVASCADGLKQLGIGPGDCVAGLLPNLPETVIAMFATTSLGAVWSSCSPDFGLSAVLDRFGQIKPKLLFTTDGYHYGGQKYQTLKIIPELLNNIQTIEKVVIVPLLDMSFQPDDDSYLLFDDLLTSETNEIDFQQLPFDHPIFIMFSSGTTGSPKGIIHGAGGTLLQHYKEHVLHTNLTRQDRVLYYTTCGWMMWNWLVSILQTGATIILYDGSPVWPEQDNLWQAVASERITVFGTSPKFLSSCRQKNLKPIVEHDLSNLKTILSTGAPLSGEDYRYVYQAVKKDIQLSSISGGTDIISCFMLGNPNLPVYTEEIQALGLGMKVEVYNDQGESLTDTVGELVCTAPFPSMPVKFLNDPDGSKYKNAYFTTFPNVWRHGDYLKITSHGSVIVSGRSDATLNPGGVRIGTAEICNPVEAMAEISDTLAVSQPWQGDSRILLFVVLPPGNNLTEDLQSKIRNVIRQAATARHVPSVIYQVDDIPRTLNGKKVELAVTRLLHGEAVSNLESLANPEVLKQYKNILQLT